MLIIKDNTSFDKKCDEYILLMSKMNKKHLLL